jgi:hypothetical protein
VELRREKVNAMQENWEEEFIEWAAANEHARWARWQSYLHSKCTRNADGSMTIPSDLVERWQRQMETPYEQLSEVEKESDREEVRPYLERVRSILAG